MRVGWMLGYLGNRDLSSFHALLMMSNPTFNAEPLYRATLNEGLHRSNFEFAVAGITYKVIKHRARSKKISYLDDNSIFAISTLLEMTRTARVALRASDPNAANRLFLTCSQTGAALASYNQFYKELSDTNSDGEVIFRLHPNLTGILPASFNPEKIRATESVIEWFRTGSVTAAARKIGNTTAVTTGHYIAPARRTA